MTARPRIGAVPYLNARPLVEGLAQSGALEFVEDVPSRLAAMLHAGQLDAALVSSVEALRHPERAVVPGLCIASRGPVRSVQLFGRSDPRAARTVAIDGASLTAAALTRVVYGRILERADVAYVAVPPAPDPTATGADATLVIGDRALALEGAPLRALDLGEAWTAWSGLPFVWALWLARDAATAARLEPVLADAYARGRRRLREYAHARADLGEERAFDYLARVMVYDLGPDERAGLERFDDERDA
jgi:chorismate dehydratase